MAATIALALVAIVHGASAFDRFDRWAEDTVWYVGTALGGLLLAAVNRAHVGLGPCVMPTAPVVRWANVAFAVFGTAAAFAVPGARVFAVLAILIVQAVASHFTLVGPSSGLSRG